MACLGWIVRSVVAAMVVVVVGCGHLDAQAQTVPATVTVTAPATVTLSILAINDFHGHIQPPATGIMRPDPDNPASFKPFPAGGAESMASLIRQLSARYPHQIFVSAGDLVGASPMISALFHDEPTIRSMNAMGLAFSAVGNHEFDEGWSELWRKQHGGCHPVDGCRGPEPFAGASFRYLAASTRWAGTDQTLFPPYDIRWFDGVPVGFIGLTLRATPHMVLPDGVRGLVFEDEVETINRLVPELLARNVRSIVVLLHEGGFATGSYNECQGMSGPLMSIVEKLHPEIDVVVSGHTHRAYNCRLSRPEKSGAVPVLVTSADKYGTLMTHIVLDIARETGDVVGAVAENLVVDPSHLPKDPQQTALIEDYLRLAGPVIHQPVGRIQQDFTAESPSGATATGQLIADALLSATTSAGAQIAFVNRGSIRSALRRTGDGVVTVGQIFAIQPFRNALVTVSMTGEQISHCLERQWSDGGKFRPLQVSDGFSYVWDDAGPVGRKIVPGSVRLNGVALGRQTDYRVTVSQYLFAGGESYRCFGQGRDPVYGMLDHEAVSAYFQRHQLIHPAPLDRVGVSNRSAEP